MEKLTEKISDVKKRIEKLDRKIKYISLLKNLSLFFILSGLVILLISLLESIGLHSTGARTILFYSLLSLEVIFTFLFFLLPLIKIFKSLTENDYLIHAQFVGKKITEIKDELINALQLSKEINKKSDLKDAAVLSALQKTENYNFLNLVSYSLLKPIYTYFLLVFLLLILFFGVGNLGKSFNRILNHNRNFIIPQRIQLLISPQDVEVTKGDNVEISVFVKGDAPTMLSLFLKNKEEKTFSRIQLFSDSLKNYSHLIPNINSTTEYYFKADEIESEHYKLTVINRPIITNIGLTISPPSYSKLEKTVQNENGNISVLKGSKITVKIASNNSLKKGEIIFSDSTQKPIAIKGKTGFVKFRAKKNLKYHISITDTNNNENIHPIEYSIELLVDEYPEIEVIEPKEDVVLNKSELVPVAIKISDDYGINSLRIKHKLVNSMFGVPEEKFLSEDIPIEKAELVQTVLYNWILTERMLTAGDVLAFYFEVFDNDIISGPKSAKSKIFYLRVPSMEELFADADTKQEEAKLDLEETLKEAEKLKEDMKELSNKLKKDDKKITWDEKKKIEETAKRLEKLQKKIESAKENIEKAKKSLDENKLLSKETLEKYNELQKLMDEMNSEEMKRAMERMQEQLKSMNRNNAQQSLEQMEFNEEMFKKSIERTVNLLKRIQIEQKMDEVIKRTEELEKKSDELKNKIEKSDLNNKSEQKELSKRKEEIEKELKRLQEEMKKLQEKMNDFKEMPNDTMKKLQKEMEAQKNNELTEKMEQMISQNMKMDAMEQMEQFSQNMKNMKSQMEQMQQQMQQQNQMEVLFEMMKNIDNLLALSKDEEKLKNEMNNSNRGSNDLLEKLQKQQEITDGLNKTVQGMSELSQKTFAITPEMGKALGNAGREMNRAMQAMQNGNGSLAVFSQKGAMKYLNEAATMMKGNMEQMMNGGQGGGMMSMMQQMQQMSQQQMGINQLTRQMQQGKLTPQQQAQMRRLQQQQEVIRKSLEQLNKESKARGDSKKLASNLEQILEEMKEVITKMNTERVDDDLIKSQEKILSKLLDAQRSINERDFEKNRESKSSNIFKRNSPSQLNIEERKNAIKDELMNLINEGYSKDYEELIRKYYEILEKERENEISK